MGKRDVVEPIEAEISEREERTRLTVARMVRLSVATPGDYSAWDTRRDVAAKLGPEASRVEIAEATIDALGLRAEYDAKLKARGMS